MVYYSERSGFHAKSRYYLFYDSYFLAINILNFSREVSGTSTSESRPLIELIKLSVPAIAGQAIEPLAQLMETAYIGRLGEIFLLSFVSNAKQ